MTHFTAIEVSLSKYRKGNQVCVELVTRYGELPIKLIFMKTGRDKFTVAKYQPPKRRSRK